MHRIGAGMCRDAAPDGTALPCRISAAAVRRILTGPVPLRTATNMWGKSCPRTGKVQIKNFPFFSNFSVLSV